MCGSLKYEDISHKIGDMVTYVTQTGIASSAPWLGHSREESRDPANSETVFLPATSYFEKGVEFHIPDDETIEAFLVKSNNFPAGEGIFIKTRPATPQEMKKCMHPRHPVLFKFYL